jgi:glycosyltransferase 2 family protein
MKDWISKNRQTLLRGAGSLLAFGLLAFLIVQNWNAIVVAIRQIPLWRFLLATALIFASRFFVVGRWHVLLRAARLNISYARTTALTFTGLFANNFLPTTIGGDVVRFAGAAEMGYDSSIVLASLVADRLAGMAGMATVLPFGLIPLWSWGTGRISQSISLAALWKKSRDFVLRTFQALTIWLKKPVSLLGAYGLTWGHLLCFFGATSVLLIGLNESVPFWTIAGILSITYFLTQIPISINGYGVQELSQTYLFVHLAGVSLPNAITLALLIRVIFMIASLPGAFYLPSILTAIDRAKTDKVSRSVEEAAGGGEK